MKRAKASEKQNEQDFKQIESCDKVKSIFSKKASSSTNIKRAKKTGKNNRAKYSKEKRKEVFIPRSGFKASSEKFEKIEKDENDSSTELSHHKKIMSYFSAYRSNQTESSVSIKNSSEGVPLKIFQNPLSITSQLSNKASNTTKAKMDDNELVTDFIINGMRAKSWNQCGYGFKAENFEQNLTNEINSKYNFTSPDIFKKRGTMVQEFETDSITNGVITLSRNGPDNSCFITENIGLSPIKQAQFNFNSPEIVTKNVILTSSATSPQINYMSDIFHRRQRAIEFPLQQFSNSFHLDLSGNTSLEELENVPNASEINSKETNNERFKAGPSTTPQNETEVCGIELVSQSDENHLQVNVTTINGISETESDNIEHRINSKRMSLKSMERGYFSVVGLNMTNCGHSQTVLKYSVIPKSCSNHRIRKTNLKAKLQTFIRKTMEDTHPDLCFKDAIGKGLELFLWDILHRIGDEAENLLTLSSNKLLDKRVLKYAIKFSLEKMKNEADVVSGKRNMWLF